MLGAQHAPASQRASKGMMALTYMHAARLQQHQQCMWRVSVDSSG